MMRLLKPWVYIDQYFLFVMPNYNANGNGVKKSQRSSTKKTCRVFGEIAIDSLPLIPPEPLAKTSPAF